MHFSPMATYTAHLGLPCVVETMNTTHYAYVFVV